MSLEFHLNFNISCHRDILLFVRVTVDLETNYDWPGASPVDSPTKVLMVIISGQFVHFRNNK